MSPGHGGAARTRIAPSPTGYFHVGTARTALYNWCVARRSGGSFVLRIEDTDRERNAPEHYAGIESALEWLGVPWDEGPFLQSERSDLYKAAADLLFGAGHLYACDCSPELVRERTKGYGRPGYDGFCRERGLSKGPGRALRFKVPRSGTTVVHDLIRGEVAFSNSTLADFVAVKSNGDALFVLAVVVDDREMAISEVIRAEEHLPTTPKAILVWEALNAAGEPRPLPRFAHLPLLVNEARKKISKRRDKVAIEDYRAQGYLPEAMANYLALLGWSFPDGRELFTRAELVEAFRLEDVNHSPAYFDERKLLHFNGIYIRALSPTEFTERCQDYAAETGSVGPDAVASWDRLAPLVQERVTVLSEVASYVGFVATDGFNPDPTSWAKAIEGDAGAGAILTGVRSAYAALESWEAPLLRSALEDVGAAQGRKLNKAQAPVRVATLGHSVGLPLFESLEVLGRSTTLARLDAAIETTDRPSPVGGRRT
ncbi:MAG: glutamate--tRNA ligase [Acidimicrobiales bacterium]